MRRLLAAALVLATSLAVTGPAAGQEPVSAGADRGSGAVGDPITVFGTGWPAGERVQVSFCGNQALNGSVDCDLAGSRSVVTDDDGHFQIDVEVVLPPEACPCVLFFVSQATPETVRFPFEVDGAAIAPAAHAAPVSTPTIEVARATVEGIGGWASWFGGAPHRELVLVLRNTGVEAAVPELDVAWGKGADPTRILDLSTLAEIPAGAERTFHLPFELDALSIGGYTIAGEVSGPGGPTPFSTSTSSYPWGGIVLLVASLQIWLVRRWRRHRSDRDRGIEIDLRDDEVVDDTRVVLDLDAEPNMEPSPVPTPTDAATSATIAELDSATASLRLAAARLRDGTTLTELHGPTVVAMDQDEARSQAEAILAEAATEREQARRSLRAANQLAEAVVARAGAQSESLLATAQRDRAQAAETLEAAEQRALELEAAATQRAVELERDARRRAAAAGRDPVGQAIRRAVVTAFDA